MERIAPQARKDAYGDRLNRAHLPLLAMVVPWLSILIASFLAVLPIAAALPVLPPLGFLMLIGWRLVRPGLLPVWAGLPLGAFDDLYSGQPFGFGIAAWSLAMIAIELMETRMPWRSFWQDWTTATLLLVAYIAGGWLFSGATPNWPSLVALGPQLTLSILLFPLAARVAARLDVLRLRRWMRL